MEGSGLQESGVAALKGAGAQKRVLVASRERPLDSVPCLPTMLSVNAFKSIQKYSGGVEAYYQKFYDKESRLSIPICWPLDVGIGYFGTGNRIPRQKLPI